MVISVTEDRAKTKNVRRDPRVSLCVLDDGFFGPWVQIDGTAEHRADARRVARPAATSIVRSRGSIPTGTTTTAPWSTTAACCCASRQPRTDRAPARHERRRHRVRGPARARRRPRRRRPHADRHRSRLGLEWGVVGARPAESGQLRRGATGRAAEPHRHRGLRRERATGAHRAHGPARCLRREVRRRGVGHQRRVEHRSSGVALGHRRCGADRAELRAVGSGRERAVR